MHSLVFFGSFQHYSVSTLDIIFKNKSFHLAGVVTTPPKPANKLVITQNPVHTYCQQHRLSCFPLESLDCPPPFSPPDFIVVCGYGKLIPTSWLNFPKIMAINIHQSLLPDYAGRYPVEWAILNGEPQTGLTFIKMSEKFDRGDIIESYPYPINPSDTKDSLYSALYRLAGQKTLKLLPKIAQGKFKLTPQSTKGFYARNLTREDGYISWQFFQDYLNSQPASANPPALISQNLPPLEVMNRFSRALLPWPGIWTITPKKLRLKIISLSPLTVQLEGKKPVLWAQTKKSFI